MGKVGARLAMSAVLVFSAVYMLQAQDSAPAAVPPPPAKAAVIEPFLTTQGIGGREYFMRRREVVPTGASILRLPILMYHYIRTPPSMRSDLLGYRLSVSPADFQAQMDWLYANQYHPVTFEQVRSYFAGRAALPSRPVVITLDDGYADLYTTAFPILQAHGFTAVAYIVSGFVDRGRYVTHDQVLQMDRAGMEIASHTVDHADMARASSGMATYELVQSKHWLENLLGHPVVDFAYPSGKYSGGTIQLLSQAGYDTAVVEDGPSLHSRADRYTWGRVRVGGGESLRDFITNLGVPMPAVTVSSLDIEP
ncbi:MAG TPA: polysaccharide deacetylase family protein [Candidatus Dormibacteraeota bacterium]|nr:polysaccharide deacetylase family protein [Candidatus Dormibacteraeota bacterium]